MDIDNEEELQTEKKEEKEDDKEKDDKKEIEVKEEKEEKPEFEPISAEDFISPKKNNLFAEEDDDMKLGSP
jgi:hypothetical protein